MIPWPEMDALIEEQVNEFRKINSGIHIGLLGTNRGGKTTLVTGNGNHERGILRHFDDVLVLDTSGDPGSISKFGKPLNKYGAIHGVKRLTVTDMTMKSKEKVHRAISRAVRQKHIAIYADELRQLTDKKFFGLGPVFDHIWLFSAKQDVTLVGGSQQPFWLPGAFYNQSKMHFIFGIRDVRSRKRLGEISGDTATLGAIVPVLNRFEFAHVTIDGDIITSKFDLHPPKKRAEKPLRTTPTVKPSKRVRITRNLTPS